MDSLIRENFIVHVMCKGFERAADSLTKLVGGRKFRLSHSPPVVIRRGNAVEGISLENGDLFVLTTQMIGEISGKSFLILSEDECVEIFKTLGNHIDHKIKEAFLLEIDNIISASVIAELSNFLEVEIYGDVPHLTRIHSNELERLLNTDSDEDLSSMIFSNTAFVFDTDERIHPQFIWRMSSKIFDIIPKEKLVA